jgi:uncharacterized protein (TIGR02145 family)
MKNGRQFIHLLLITGILFANVTACNKTNDQTVVDQNAGKPVDADGNVYKTVKIGTQVWMAENLKTTKYNDGTPIENVTNDSLWGNLATGAYCNYDNLESNAATYGRLYNWYAINTGKLAPSGWHVPSEDDWFNLLGYLTANGYNYDSTKFENKCAKSLASKTSWPLSDWPGSPGANPARNDSTGFNALPAGIRTFEDNEDQKGFKYLGQDCYWWSSTQVYSNYADGSALFYNWSGLQNTFYHTVNGFSVRLVRN